MAKRSIGEFFSVSAKKQKIDDAPLPPSSTWPKLPDELAERLEDCAADAQPKTINNRPDLDLLYFQPYMPKDVADKLYDFLLHNVPFYRVQYKIKRGPVETQINTPRYTTVFGVDDSSTWDESKRLVDKASKKPVPKDRYKCTPTPMPDCLDFLRRLTEACTGESFNFCLVNYYASGSDSISYHSDDERFLGVKPSIASFSLGAKRDFLMKHKPVPVPVPPSDKNEQVERAEVLKFPLAAGDMILMRGSTQSCWLHSIPKRKTGEHDRGRINITFRKAMVRGGTENYYQYNVGSGGMFRWNASKKEMVPCVKQQES